VVLIDTESPDVWYRPTVKENEEEYYKYMFVNTDDILAIRVDPNGILITLNKYFKLKPDSIHAPDDYLGTKIKLTTLPNERKALGQSSSHYIRAAIKNLEAWMTRERYRLSKRASTPMSSSYRHELDMSQERNAEKANYYQSIIGVLQWIVETGCLAIVTEVSMLAAHMGAPREGHIRAAFLT
jgi:hypothetical protein